MMIWRSRRKPLFCLLMVFLLGFPWAPSAWGDDQEPARVLVLQSYHKGFSWTDDLQRGIESVLEGSGKDIEIAVEYMDAKRQPVRQVFDKLADLYEFKYRRWQPDLIISCDDDALAFLFEYRDRIYPGVPVVFCGLDVESYDPAILKGRQGYTGVVERLDLTGTIDLILDLQPAVERIAVIHDLTTSGRFHRQTIEGLAPRYGDDVDFIYPNSGVGLTEAELLSFLRGLDARSAVYFLGFSRDRLDKPLPLHHIIPLISQASPVPVYTHADAYFRYGTLGGKLLSAEIHGRSTAAKALRLLKGTPVSQVPVSVESSNRYVFDYRQLRRFSIPESRLPEGSVVAFEPVPFLELHRTAVLWAVLGILTLTAFTIALLVNMARRHGMEKALRQSEEKFQKAFHSCPAFMSISTLDEGRFLEVNSEFLRLMGFSREEVIGRKAVDVGFWNQTGREPILSELKQKGYAHHKEIDIRLKTGEEYHLLWFGDVVSIGGRECLVVTGYDQTERKKAEKSLQESEEKLRIIVENSGDGIALAGSDPIELLYVNKSMSDIFGYSSEELLSMTMADFMGMFHPDHRGIAAERLRNRFNGKPVSNRSEYRIVAKNGDVRWIELYADTVEIGGKRAVLAGCRHITVRKEAEAQLQAYSTRLEEMVADRTRELEKVQEELLVRERLAVLGHFAGSVSHELRNPLGAIDASIYYLQMKLGTGDGKIADHLARAHANIARSTAIIESLLNLSRMEKPRTRPHAATGLMSDILRSAKIPETVQTETIFPENEAAVEVDADQIRMALKNILHNAVQAMEGKGALTIAVRRGDEDQVEFSISDTGPGIAPENLEKIFQPLFSTKVHGIGFGLSIARMIFERHGGGLIAESRPGEGARFKAVLPMAGQTGSDERREC